jgi:transposase
MEYQEYVGIDISKNEIEVYLHLSSAGHTFPNNPEGFAALIDFVENRKSKNSALFCFEDTGLYSYPITLYLSQEGLAFVIVSGLEMKRSLGISRGKTDKVDARRIALYAYRRREELKPVVMADPEFQDLKRLLSLRDRLVKQRAGFDATLNEYAQFINREKNELLFSTQEALVKELIVQIKRIEDELNRLIRSKTLLKKQHDLLTSIKGIGTQTALYLIVITEGFSKFKSTRECASYCGIAPFPYSSGTSVHGKTKVSPLANRKMKSMLYLCAISAIQWNTDMKLYYQRKVSEGKAKKSVLNAVSNKLLARAFSVINRGTCYVETKAYAS